ncbi:hypothetical protein C8R43DRAFT_1047724 [Mycena crocata]|nr:hypothetical protein C8R43DRAFT_1047724 [Mycena crocata]
MYISADLLFAVISSSARLAAALFRSGTAVDKHSDVALLPIFEEAPTKRIEHSLTDQGIARKISRVSIATLIFFGKVADKNKTHAHTTALRVSSARRTASQKR